MIDRLVDEGILAGHGRYCPPLPDLRIGAVEYNQEHERLGVTVENYGEVSPLSGRPDGGLINANVTIFVNLPDGRPIAHTFPNVDISMPRLHRAVDGARGGPTRAHPRRLYGRR